MTSRTVIIFLLVFFLDTLIVRAVPQDGQDNALKPFFNVQTGASAARGGCDNHEAILKGSWEEACKMSRQAWDDLNFVQQNMNTGQGPDRKQDPDGSKRWRRVYAMLYAMFGASDSQTISHVQDFYKQMRDACSTREAPKADTLILCDDKFIKWYPNDAPDPEHPDSKIEDSYPQCEDFGGLWYTNELPDSSRYRSRYRFSPPPPTPDSQYRCNSGLTASTLAIEQMITWCPRGFEEEPSLDAIKAKIKGPKTLSLLAPALIKADLLTHLDFIGGGNVFGDMPTIWVHEMVHAFYNWPDEQSYDGKGNLKTTKTSLWDDEAQEYTMVDQPVLTYGFKYSSRLAKHGFQRAIKSAEPYALFAKAMYLSEWDWHLGYAQPLS